MTPASARRLRSRDKHAPAAPTVTRAPSARPRARHPCSKCKNGQLLPNGAGRVGACEAAGGTPKGSGRFGRYCHVVNLEATTAPAATPTFDAACVGQVAMSADGDSGECWCGRECHSCAWSTSEAAAGMCTKCKHSLALYTGACLSTVECEALSGSVVGTGRFGRSAACLRHASASMALTPCHTGTVLAPSTNVRPARSAQPRFVHQVRWPSPLLSAGVDGLLELWQLRHRRQPVTRGASNVCQVLDQC